MGSPCIAHQAPLSMGFSKQEYWRGLPCPLPVDLTNSGIEPESDALHEDCLPSEPPGKPVINLSLTKSNYEMSLFQLYIKWHNEAVCKKINTYSVSLFVSFKNIKMNPFYCS